MKTEADRLIGLLEAMRFTLTRDLEWALSVIEQLPQTANVGNAEHYVEARRHLKASLDFARSVSKV